MRKKHMGECRHCKRWMPLWTVNDPLCYGCWKYMKGYLRTWIGVCAGCGASPVKFRDDRRLCDSCRGNDGPHVDMQDPDTERMIEQMRTNGIPEPDLDVMPTDEEMRTCFDPSYCERLDPLCKLSPLQRERMFDRWMAEHDRQVAEKAYREGYSDGWYHGWDDDGDNNCHDNPYQKDNGQETGK